MTTDMSVWEIYSRSVDPLNKKNRVIPFVEKAVKHIHVAPKTLDLPPLRNSRPHLKVQESISTDFKKRSIEATIDLHGCTCHQAENQLVHFFHRAQQRHLKTVLVITGKGCPDNDDQHQPKDSFGVLRQFTLHWFAENPQFVVSYSVAAQNHGGLGAFYVHVRRMV